MKYVVVGAGPAGVVAAETLRRVDPSGEVVLLGGEAGPPYSRMAIPYILTNRIDGAGAALRKSADHYENLGIRYVQGQAESLSTAKGLLRLEGDETLSFDRLLVATGSRPIQPPIPGLDGEAIHHCWTLDDAQAIGERATPGAHVVLMGAGFIGCIVMEALAQRHVNLTVVEMEDRMVPRMMNEPAASLIKDWCEAKGVRVRTKAQAKAVEPQEGGANRVLLEDGETLPADLVVVATGVKPNIGFLKDSGVETDMGVVVDEHLRTTSQNIFAAGDVAQGPGFGGGNAVHAIQPTAVEHGRIAALNMVGKTAVYQGSLPMNVLDTLGLVSFSFGAWDGVQGGENSEIMDKKNSRYLRLEFLGESLVGALGVGLMEHVGVLRGLIQSRTPLKRGWKQKLLVDPTRIAEAYVVNTCI